MMTQQSILSKKPDYLSQIGKDGTYKLNGLAESVYRVFAVKDEFRDLLYQADQDWIGIPSKEISLTDSDSSYSGLDFFLMKVDTVKPRIAWNCDDGYEPFSFNTK